MIGRPDKAATTDSQRREWCEAAMSTLLLAPAILGNGIIDEQWRSAGS
jgi:hypothetical protein